MSPPNRKGLGSSPHRGGHRGRDFDVRLRPGRDTWTIRIPMAVDSSSEEDGMTFWEPCSFSFVDAA